MKTNYYEHTFIVNAVLDEADIKANVEKHVSFLKDNGAEVEELDDWGIQRLAYEIDGKRSGYYVNMYFTAPSDLIARFERQLQIDDNVIRYMTIKYDSKMKRHRELQKKGAVPEVFPQVPADSDEVEN
jgi:small subunit ribosomal protein S6